MPPRDLLFLSVGLRGELVFYKEKKEHAHMLSELANFIQSKV